MKPVHEGPVPVSMCIASKKNRCKYVIQHPFMPIFRCGHHSIEVKKSRVGDGEDGVVAPHWCPILKEKK